MPRNQKTRLTLRGESAPDPNTVPLRVEVSRMVYRRAVRLTAAYTRLSLGQVLERWVTDAAHGANQLDSWEHRQLTRWLRGHPFPKETRPHSKHRARRTHEEDSL